MIQNSIFPLLYIDPGTGSMLFTIVIGLISTLIFAFKDKILKLKFLFSGGKVEKASKNKLPYVIFTDSKRYWNLFKPICDEFEKRQLECYYYTASPDDPALEEPYSHVKCQFIGEGNKAYAKMNMLNASICLSTTPGLDVLQWKRSKETDYYVHVFHGVDEGTGYRMFGMDFFDAVLLTGAFQERYIRILEEKRNFPRKEVEVVGCTYMDVMKEKHDLLQSTKSDNDEFTVLLAPSWGVSSILNKYGEKILKALVDTGYNIIVRPHPQSYISDPDLINDLKKKFPDGDKFSWNADNDNYEVLNKSDIMITDFSAIIFDYTYIFEKPIIYADTEFDVGPYDAAWIDEEVWRLAVLPKLGKKLSEDDFADMKSIIDSVSDSEEYKKGREECRNTSWQCIGEAATRTVDYLVKKYDELQQKSDETKQK